MVTRWPGGQYTYAVIAVPRDQITIKTPNPKFCLYWCLIEFIDWRYSHAGIFESSCELAHLYLLSSPPPQ
jgi:hypothetical protein